MDAIGMFHIKHAAPGLWGYVLHFLYFLDVLSRGIWNIDGQMINVLRHLWTVPVEFTSSMALFVVIIGISRFSTKGRMRCLTWLMLFALYYDHAGFFSFIGGMFIAELEEDPADPLIKNDTEARRRQDNEEGGRLSKPETDGEARDGDQLEACSSFHDEAKHIIVYGDDIISSLPRILGPCSSRLSLRLWVAFRQPREGTGSSPGQLGARQK